MIDKIDKQNLACRMKNHRIINPGITRIELEIEEFHKKVHLGKLLIIHAIYLV